jgi:secondary thiamine-phosphate synthase enzyme
MHATTEITIATRGQGLYEFTAQVEDFVRQAGVDTGLVTVFCRHTSASLTIQENADPDVRADLNEFFRRLVPENMGWLRHTIEGPDDMPAHIKAALTDVSLSIPVMAGRMVLGTWQGIYLFEHRAAPCTPRSFCILLSEWSHNLSENFPLFGLCSMASVSILDRGNTNDRSRNAQAHHPLLRRLQ